MSLRIASSWRAESRAIAARSRCAGSRSVRRIRSSMPITPFIGVRISWLMVARNCDLATEAPSASSRLASSSSLRCTSAVTSQLTPTIFELPSVSR